MYNEPWKYLVRLENKTARRGEYIPYCMIESLHQYLKSCNNEQILDIGCGENNNKLFFPNIIGFDKTHEADIFGWQHDDAWNNLPQFENGIAVNSLHWNNIRNNIEKAVEKCKRIFITLNENQDITIFKKRETWEQIGDVEYFWHGQKEQTKKDILQYLENDTNYHQHQQEDNADIQADAQSLFDRSVLRDPYFGVVRVVLKRR